MPGPRPGARRLPEEADPAHRPAGQVAEEQAEGDRDGVRQQPQGRAPPGAGGGAPGPAPGADHAEHAESEDEQGQGGEDEVGRRGEGLLVGGLPALCQVGEAAGDDRAVLAGDEPGVADDGDAVAGAGQQGLDRGLGEQLAVALDLGGPPRLLPHPPAHAVVGALGGLARRVHGRDGAGGHDAPSVRRHPAAVLHHRPACEVVGGIGSILQKLDLPVDSTIHRRVLAVLTYLRA